MSQDKSLLVSVANQMYHTRVENRLVTDNLKHHFHGFAFSFVILFNMGLFITGGYAMSSPFLYTYSLQKSISLVSGGLILTLIGFVCIEHVRRQF